MEASDAEVNGANGDNGIEVVRSKYFKGSDEAKLQLQQLSLSLPPLPPSPPAAVPTGGRPELIDPGQMLLVTNVPRGTSTDVIQEALRPNVPINIVMVPSNETAILFYNSRLECKAAYNNFVDHDSQHPDSQPRVEGSLLSFWYPSDGAADVALLPPPLVPADVVPIRVQRDFDPAPAIEAFFEEDEYDTSPRICGQDDTTSGDEENYIYEFTTSSEETEECSEETEECSEDTEETAGCSEETYDEWW